MKESWMIYKFITFLEHVREPRLSSNEVNSILKSSKSVEGKWVTQAVSPWAMHRRMAEPP